MPPFSMRAVLAADGFSKWIVAVRDEPLKSIEAILPQKLLCDRC